MRAQSQERPLSVSITAPSHASRLDPERVILLAPAQHASPTPPEKLVRALEQLDLEALGSARGHFAALATVGTELRMARTLGATLRWFVAKRDAGPVAVIADRIAAIRDWCREQGLLDQFRPEYTRMVPAHHVAVMDLRGCPDPAPRFHRFAPDLEAEPLPADLAAIGRAYAGAALEELRLFFAQRDAGERFGVAFSGGIDSTAVWLLARRALEQLGRDPNRISAFTLSLGGGADVEQALAVAAALGLRSSHQVLEAAPEALEVEAAIAETEDYKPLDVACAAMARILCQRIREAAPEVRWLLDGDGGDENLKSYPIADDGEVTIRSVVNNPLLYQEGWGVSSLKHSAVYSGGLSRGAVRGLAPARLRGLCTFSPLATPAVVGAAARIPFRELVGEDHARLYALKGEVVRSGVRDCTGVSMSLQPKRRFQDGPPAEVRRRGEVDEATCRSVFARLWSA
ncbi:MAG TPA: asparagine synthase-related protein [Acidobacteriota bacterium]